MINQSTKILETRGMVEYTLKVCKHYGEEIGIYFSYGIEVIAGKDSMVIEDISLDEMWTIDLVNKLNTLGVSPLHVMDVILDSLQ